MDIVLGWYRLIGEFNGSVIWCYAHALMLMESEFVEFTCIGVSFLSLCIHSLALSHTPPWMTLEHVEFSISKSWGIKLGSHNLTKASIECSIALTSISIDKC